MPKLFLSFLGTGDYAHCNYRIGDTVLGTRFVQEAICSHLFAKPMDGDKVVIFATEDARIVNWVDSQKSDMSQIGLQSSLKLNLDVSCVSIPHCESEEDIWELFKIVYEEIREGDELFLDITHSFRFMPMLATILLNYAKATKKVEVKNIFYGMFDFEKSKRADYIAEIIDLTSLNDLQDWGNAVSQFVKNGVVRDLCSQAEKHYGPICRETRGQNISANNLRILSTALSEFVNIIITCRGPSITDASIKVKNILSKISGEIEFEIVKPLIKLIEDRLSGFSENDILNGIEVAKWCNQNHFYQQAYTFLQETIISFCLEKIEVDTKVIKYRDVVSSSVKVSLGQIEKESLYGAAKDNPKILDDLLEFHRIYPGLAELFRNLSNYRNDFNHAGFKKDRMTPARFERDLSVFIEKVEKCVR